MVDVMSFNLDFTEDGLVEQPSIDFLKELGWEFMNCMEEKFPSGSNSHLGRGNRSEVLLKTRLYDAIQRLNPGLDNSIFTLAIAELDQDWSTMPLVDANRIISNMLQKGIDVNYRGSSGDIETETVKIVDWNDVSNNDFLLTSQLWITGKMHTRRTDLVGFINGIPLLFIELKTTHINVKDAFSKNLRDYKSTIPHLFWYNGFIILSNGSDSKIGTITSSWEHFVDWKRVNDESENARISLEIMLKGTCEPSKLLDLVENFSLFSEVQNGTAKILAKNHQYLGVNKAIRRLREGEISDGKLGVFWHTQGSGKSISMVMFCQKILRKIPGNWSFVVVTDRAELDDQIYKNFAATGSVIGKGSQAKSSKDLRKLLSENHRYIFTLIQKFRTENTGDVYQKVSERDDIIVLVDEAHRSQYDTFALNMRNAMPKAQFMAFTGTPLISEEEKTRDVFGDYISIYNFRQSIEDGATVPLYYENRIPELQLTNDDLDEQVYRIVEEAGLDEDQERKLEREFARQYHLITRDDRLEKIAEDMVNHFIERGNLGKAMFIAIDKATSIKMYDKVQHHWNNKIRDLEDSLQSIPLSESINLRGKIDFMKSTEMAVVVSQSQNEIEDMEKKGVDVRPHRQKMVDEDLDTIFKDVNSDFRIVFLCAMWTTGFDVPNCSTIYLDKPIKNHTLMQTIARANRVYDGKMNGVIVDYIGVFRNLNEALAIYGSGNKSEVKPVESKQVLVEMLNYSVIEMEEFLSTIDISIEEILNSAGFNRIKLVDDAIESILDTDVTKNSFKHQASTVLRIWKAILPDPSASKFTPQCVVIKVLLRKLQSLNPSVSIQPVMEDIGNLLDDTIEAEGYVIEGLPEDNLIDIGRIDFDGLAENFATSNKKTEIEKIRAFINRKLTKMIKLNKSRLDFGRKFQDLVDQYNEGALNTQIFFEALVDFAETLDEEEVRPISEGLTEEELAVFDILVKKVHELSIEDISRVKSVARSLAEKLNQDHIIVLDWRKHQTTRAVVETIVDETLDNLPIELYHKELYQEKCADVFSHIYDNYFDNQQNTFVLA